MKNSERNYTPPFLIQMTSSEIGKHCDYYPFGSIHKVKQSLDADAVVCDADRIHLLSPGFEYQKLDVTSVETKSCPDCKRDFLLKIPFVNSGQRGDDVERCNRCHCKKYVVNREVLVDAIRQELLMELKAKNNEYQKSEETV